MEYNQNLIGSSLVDAIRGLENVGTLLTESALDGSFETIIPPAIQEILEEVLKTSLGDKQNLDMEKLIAAALAIAKEMGVLPVEMPDFVPSTLASIADEVYTRIKVAYQTSEGVIDLTEATDILIDAAASRVIPVLMPIVDNAIDTGLPVVLEEASMALASVFPPAGVLVPYVPMVANFLKEPAKQLVHKGVNMLKEGAKVIVKTATKTILKAGQKIGRVLTSLL
ncbi:MAG: hypothetical protein IJR02_05230 [Bacteroidaceae bacterium]|nr:hypothetical protein [Bacteroidaceae bacterium]